MILLPVPCWLLFGGQLERLIALAAFTLLALTDWWDGKIARKQGPTVLGSLLDPIADKMFLAFTYLPMACIEGEDGSGWNAIPVWIVSLVFLRELAVTGMRGLAASHGIEFTTATLAKFKTAFQMGGGGVLFWNLIWQHNLVVTVVGNLVLVAMAAGIAIYRRIDGRGVGAKVWTQVGAYSCATAAVILLPLRYVLLIIALSILGLTLLSGVNYAVRTFNGLREKGWPARPTEILLALAESVVPVGVVAMLAIEDVPVWAPILMLTGELAAGGLLDLIATAGVARRRWLAWLRVFGLIAAVALGWLGATLLAVPALVFWAPVAAAAISTSYCAGLFIAHRALYLR